MKKIIISILFIIIVFFASVISSLNNYDIEEVIICSINNESHLIPSNVCELYLHEYRGAKDDIALLKKRSGLSFVFDVVDKNKRTQLLDFLLLKGSDIDGLSNVDGLTPLHAAILLNDIELLNYLLMNDANPLVKDRDNSLTSKQFLELLIIKDAITDRSALIDRLNKI